MAQNIDDEWSNFLSKNYNDDSSDGEHNNSDEEINKNNNNPVHTNSKQNFMSGSAPEPTPIYISTKSKIAYLLDPVDLSIFWEIPVIPYGTPRNGVIKKQIKFNSKSQEELNIINEKLQKELYYDEHVMTHIDNPNGRIKFKDIRKITVGISKKDIMSYRSKKKQAFYNCFVMIIRIKIDEVFREFHIKVFNTGKLEIPGIQSDEMFEIVLQNIISILQPHVNKELSYKQISDTVLINSNFNCGFYVNRETLFDILKYKYKIHAIYDPCSYPGIQCKFYYNNKVDNDKQTGIQFVSEEAKKMDKKDKVQKSSANSNAKSNTIEVSFMIFRTGSVLIVGMCEENILNDIYTFLTNLLKTEFEHVCQSLISENHIALKDKKKKVRRKIINITVTDEEVCMPTLINNKEDTVFEIMDVTDRHNVEKIQEVETILPKKRSYRKKA